MARKTKLTKELIEQVAEHTRNGAFAHVAAQAAGISAATFHNWMKDAQNPDCDDPLKLEFFERVSEARASARTDAENRVYQDDPFKWLRYGPGRERPNDEGWTSEQTITVATENDVTVNLEWEQSADDEPTED